MTNIPQKPTLQHLQTLQSQDFLERLTYENAATIDKVEILPSGSLSFTIGTYDDTPLNEADILRKLELATGFRIETILFYEKMKGCSPGGTGCPIHPHSTAGCEATSCSMATTCEFQKPVFKN